LTDSATAFGPGRVNLIGEHTDYNDGLALPFAISEGVTVHAARTGDDRVHAIATDLDAHDTFELNGCARVPGWRAFVRGAVGELTSAGAELVGARLEISGSVPRGSGLSSSAALEVALCLALLAVSDAPVPDRLELARICSRIENEWVGARTGLLDQIASLCGERDRALRIDFRSLEVTPVALDLEGFSLVTLDSGQRHVNAGRRGAVSLDSGQRHVNAGRRGAVSLDSGQRHANAGERGGGDEEPGYNQRRAECARACELLGVDSLREVTLQQAAELPEPLAARARHVITENERVEQTVAALSAGELLRVGELLDASHASLRDCFAVSTDAVEATVERLHRAGAVGARILGGGFGGHVLGLLPPGVPVPDGAVKVRPGPGAHLLP
jgi:galactokinase